MKYFEIGDKVKIPKTKCGKPHKHNDVVYKNVKKLNLDFLYYHGPCSNGNYHMLCPDSPDERGCLTGDFYNLDEIELYEKSVKQLNYDIY